MAGRVVESQELLLVKTGTSSWKAKTVPVGRRLAKCAMLVRLWDITRCGKGCAGISLALSSTFVEGDASSCLGRSDMSRRGSKMDGARRMKRFKVRGALCNGEIYCLQQ